MSNEKKTFKKIPSSSSNKFSKALNNGKTLFLMKIGKQDQTEYPPEFISNNNKTKEIIVTYNELIKATKKFFKSGLGYIKGNEGLIVALKGFQEKIEENSELHRLISIYNENNTQYNTWRVEYQEEASKLFVVKLEEFLSNEIDQARKFKNEFRKAKISYDAAHSKLLTATKKENIDPINIFSLHQEYHYAKRKFQRLFLEASNRLEDVVYSKDFKLVEMIVSFLEKQTTFYDNASRLAESKEETINELKLSSEQKRTSFYEQVKFRHQTKQETVLRNEDEKYDELVRLLSSPQLHVVNSICLSAGKDQSDTLEVLVMILDAYKKTLPIIKLGIEQEVESTSKESTLFRGNSTPTKLMTAFTKLTGKPYLLGTIKPIVEKVCQDSSGYEVNPEKVEGGENCDENMQKLINTSQLFLDTIINSVDICPLPFRDMASHLRREVKKKFPESGLEQSVGGFLFLRFFCPVILSPDTNDVVPSSAIDKEARRALILISKSLQNLSNGIKFGKKEKYMEKMNVFIDENSKKLNSFFDIISTAPENSDNYEPLASIKDAKEVHLPNIVKLLVKNLDKISKSLKQHESSDEIPKLAEILSGIQHPN